MRRRLVAVDPGRGTRHGRLELADRAATTGLRSPFVCTVYAIRARDKGIAYLNGNGPGRFGMSARGRGKFLRA